MTSLISLPIKPERNHIYREIRAGIYSALSAGNNVAVTGLCGIGKTSALLWVQSELERDTPSLAEYLDCRGSEFKKRAGEIYHARGRIFLLDEATVMARKKGITGNMEPTDYLSGLSTACVAIHKGSGRRGANGLIGSLHNYREFTLGSIDDREATEMLSEFGFQYYTIGAVKRIMKLGGGIPFILNAVAYAVDAKPSPKSVNRLYSILAKNHNILCSLATFRAKPMALSSFYPPVAIIQ